jgi:hypothetical protein
LNDFVIMQHLLQRSQLQPSNQRKREERKGGRRRRGGRGRGELVLVENGMSIERCERKGEEEKRH